MSQKGERVPFREEWNFPQVLSVYVGLAKTETGTLEEVGLVAEQVSLSMTSTQAALSVIFLSSSSLNFVFSQTLLCLLLTPSSHTPKGADVYQGKKAWSNLEDGPGNQKGFLCYQPELSLWDDGHTSVYDKLCDRWPPLTSRSDFSSASIFLISTLFSCPLLRFLPGNESAW